MGMLDLGNFDWSLGLGDEAPDYGGFVDNGDYSAVAPYEMPDTGMPYAGYDPSFETGAPDLPYAGYNDAWELGGPGGDAAPGGGFMDTVDSMEKWMKAHPFMTKLGFSSVLGAGTLLGNIASASANKKNTQKLLDAQSAAQGARDNPSPYPGMGGAGLQPQTPSVPDYAMLGTNPLAVYANPALSGYRLPAHASGGLAGFADGGEYAGGGHPHGGGLNAMRMVPDSGAGGQQDDVPAMLSSKEYVMDADTVAALGDGNPDEGARRLDAWRERLRRHKRSAPAHKIPPKARAPESYLSRRAA